MLYHPDKHSDENRREAAEVFNKVQYAYEGKCTVMSTWHSIYLHQCNLLSSPVLSDSNKRHIYDSYGKKGLEADWQVRLSVTPFSFVLLPCFNSSFRLSKGRKRRKKYMRNMSGCKEEGSCKDWRKSLNQRYQFHSFSLDSDY